MEIKDYGGKRLFKAIKKGHRYKDSSNALLRISADKRTPRGYYDVYLNDPDYNLILKYDEV